MDGSGVNEMRLRRALREPGRAWSVGLSLVHGWWYKTWYRLRGTRFRAGRNFRVAGRLIVRGPGSVVFGDDVLIAMTVTPWTYSAEAMISVGDGTFLNGTSFGCRKEIRIGPRCIVADARIMDTDFHSTRRDRHDDDAPVRVAAVVLEENVWVAAAAGILPGTTIRRNSVVGFGAVCSGDYPADQIIGGNPARVLRPIPERPTQ